MYANIQRRTLKLFLILDNDASIEMSTVEFFFFLGAEEAKDLAEKT